MRHLAPIAILVVWTGGHIAAAVLLLPVVVWNLARLIVPVGTRHRAAKCWSILTRRAAAAARPGPAPPGQPTAERIWKRTNALVWLVMVALFVWTEWFQN
jgi:hypothetical protein